MMQYPLTDVLLITSVSMVVLFLVLAAMAGMVNLLITFMSGRDAPRKSETEESQPTVVLPHTEGLDQIAAVVGVALARARAARAYPRMRSGTLSVGFNPWRDWSRGRTTGYFDRGWRPR